jgi:sarcosine oxidase
VYDVLVVGLGAMGSAAVHHLAALGARVVGVDAYAPPHDLGSTHGRTRIIREAYYEHPSYVPLVRRAFANWEALERASGVTLFRRTGGLMMGAPDSGLVRGALQSAVLHDIDVEMLSSAEIARRYPAFAPDSEMVAVYEHSAGVLFPELCVRACLDLASSCGAELRVNTRVSRLDANGDGIVAETSGGRIAARRLVLAAGPWTASLLEQLGAPMPLVVERQTMHWLESGRDARELGPERFPVALIEHEPNRIFYAIPDLGDGVKAAIHYEGAIVAPDAVVREVGPGDTEPVVDLVRRYVPAAGDRIRESAVCLYTNTPDLDFIIDTLEATPNVVLASACSGHGFKFASAVGEVAAQLALGESPGVDVSHFRASRFAAV